MGVWSIQPDAKRLKVSFKRVRISHFLRKNQRWECHFLSGFDLRKVPLMEYELPNSEDLSENGQNLRMLVYKVHEGKNITRGFAHNPMDFPYLTQLYDLNQRDSKLGYVFTGNYLDWRNLPDWCRIRITEDGVVLPKEFPDDESWARHSYREALTGWIKDCKNSLLDWKQFDPSCNAAKLVEKEIEWCEKRLASFDKAEEKRDKLGSPSNCA